MTETEKDAHRYNKLRRMNLKELGELWELAVRGYNFDALVDNWPNRPEGEIK